MALSGGTARKGSGKRQRWRGKMVQPNGSPRSHTHGGHSPAMRGWSVGDAGPEPGVPKGKDQTTKHLPARFRANGAPSKRGHRRGSYGSIS